MFDAGGSERRSGWVRASWPTSASRHSPTWPTGITTRSPGGGRGPWWWATLLRTLGGPVSQAAFSPDGKALVAWGRKAGVKRWELARVLNDEPGK